MNPAARPWTIIGLCIALFAIPAITTAQRLLGATGEGSTLVREVASLAATALLFWIVIKRERLPLSSIGIHTAHLGRTLLWSLGLAALCFAAVVAVLAIYGMAGISYGTGASVARALPLTLLTVVRAGISEEIFYRGYAIERLEKLTGKTWLAAAIPLLAFAGFHFRQGLAGIGLALVLGGIITIFYLWKRNLLATIAAHFLVDFIPNVIFPLLAGAQDAAH